MAFGEEGKGPATQGWHRGRAQKSSATDLLTEAGTHFTGAPPSEQGESGQERTHVAFQPSEPLTQSADGQCPGQSGGVLVTLASCPTGVGAGISQLLMLSPGCSC